MKRKCTQGLFGTVAWHWVFWTLCDFEASSIILSHLVAVGNVSLWVYIEVGICFCAMPTNLLDLLPFKWGRCYGRRSEIPPKVLMWTEISQDLDHRSSGSVGCTCDVLTQLNAISSGGYIKELQFPCSVFFFFLSLELLPIHVWYQLTGTVD